MRQTWSHKTSGTGHVTEEGKCRLSGLWFKLNEKKTGKIELGTYNPIPGVMTTVCFIWADSAMHLNKCSGPVAVNQQGPSGSSVQQLL